MDGDRLLVPTLAAESLQKPPTEADEDSMETPNVILHPVGDIVCFSEEFEESWEDAQCLATVWLGVSIGTNRGCRGPRASRTTPGCTLAADEHGCTGL